MDGLKEGKGASERKTHAQTHACVDDDPIVRTVTKSDDDYGK